MDDMAMDIRVLKAEMVYVRAAISSLVEKMGYKREEKTTGGWKDVRVEKPKDGDKCLAVCKTEANVIYNLLAQGWFRDVVYACEYRDERFVIEPHGTNLPATHWMESPQLP